MLTHSGIKNHYIIEFFRKKISPFILNQDGGSMIESGLLIGFAVLMFYLLINTVELIFNWADSNVNKIINILP
jgi:hypothetical protein